MGCCCNKDKPSPSANHINEPSTAFANYIGAKAVETPQTAIHKKAGINITLTLRFILKNTKNIYNI